MLTPETEDLSVVGYDTPERFDHRPVKIVPTDAPMDDFIIEVKSRPGYIGGHGPAKLPIQPMADYDEGSWSILESIKRKGKDYYIIQFQDNKAARRYIKHYEAFEWVSPAVLEEWEYYEFKKVQKILAQEEEEAEAEEKLKKAKRAERRRPRNRPRIVGDDEDVDNGEGALQPRPSVKKEKSALNRDTVKPAAVPTLSPSRASKQPTLVQPLAHVFSGTSAKRNITQMSSREDTPLTGTSEQAAETSEDDGPAPKRRLFEVRIPTPSRNTISNLQSSARKREKSTSSNIQERLDSQIYEEMPKSKVVVDLSSEESSEEDIAERKKVTESASLTKMERATDRPAAAARRFPSASQESTNLTKPSSREKSRSRDARPVPMPQKNVDKEQWIVDHFLDERIGPVDNNGTRPQQLLVKWRGRPEATWELADSFPERMVSDFRKKAEETKKADKKRASSSTPGSVARKKVKTIESDDDDDEILFETSPGGQDARSAQDDGGSTSMSPVKPTFPDKFYGSSIRSAPAGQGLPPKAQRPVRFPSESADAMPAAPVSAKKRAPTEAHTLKSILDHKTKAKKKPAVTMFLVEWEGSDQSTWEPQTNLPKHAVRLYFDNLAAKSSEEANKTAGSGMEAPRSARKMPVRPASGADSNMAMPPPAVPRSARKMPVTSAAHEAPRSARKMPALTVKRSVDTSADSDSDHGSSATPDVPQRARKKPVTSAAPQSAPRARKMPATPSAIPVMDGFNLPVVPSPSDSSNDITKRRERSEGQSSSSKKKGLGLISKTPIKRAPVQTKLNFFGANSKATPNKNSILSLSPARKPQPTPPQPQRRESFQADDLDFTWGSESGSPGQKKDAPSSQAKSGHAGNNDKDEESEDEISIMPKPRARKTPVKPRFGWEDDDDEDEFMRN